MHSPSLTGEEQPMRQPPGSVASVLDQARHMEALAQVAGGIAPALNDLLTVITGRAGLLLDAPTADPSAQEAVQEIYTAGERAVSLVRQLLIFSGARQPHPRIFELSGHIEETVGVLRRLLGPGIAVELRLAPGLPCVPADADLLEQLLINLALNAREAMPGGGTFRLTTEAVTIAAAEAEEFPGGRAGDFVTLSVTDNGSGIAPEILPRIFEPFFTTKGAGERLGLGLATVFAIVQQHQGWLAVESAPGAGATFKVFLPAAPPEAKTEVTVHAAVKPDGGHETILLVEDDSAVREFTVAVLQQYGYRVLQAGTVADALETWKWHGPRIGLLLTDMVLSDDMTGLELAEKFRAEKPGLRVICTSGHSREIVGPSAGLAGECHFLQKPCRPQTLARAVRAILDGQTPLENKGNSS